MNLTARIERTILEQPDKPAYIHPSSRRGQWQIISYRQFAGMVERFSRGFQVCRIESGMRIALMIPPSMEFMALAISLMKLGIVPVILDPTIGLANVTTCLAETEPDGFLGNHLTHAIRRLYGWGKNTIQYNLSIPALLRAADRNTEQPVIYPQLTPSAPAAVIYTSGSTGLPKGALYTRTNFNAQLEMLSDVFQITTDEVDLPAFPLYGLIDVLLGLTSVIPDTRFPKPARTDPAKVLDAIQRFNVTNMFASPVVLDILVRAQENAPDPRRQTPSLKRIITAGAPATIPLQERFRALLHDQTQLFGIYGTTEVLPIAIVESRELFGAVRQRTARGAGVCLGRPVPGAEVRIIRISDAPCEHWEDTLLQPSNQVGEITVKGEAVTETYVGRERDTRLSKIKDGDWIIHRTGDLGYFDEDGLLWYCGRKSHRVIMENELMFTEQIEGIFNAHPLVYRTALVKGTREPVLWVELKKGFHRIDRAKVKHELIHLAKFHFQASMVKTFLFSKKFPTDIRHNSKIIREKLAKMAK